MDDLASELRLGFIGNCRRVLQQHPEAATKWSRYQGHPISIKSPQPGQRPALVMNEDGRWAEHHLGHGTRGAESVPE